MALKVADENAKYERLRYVTENFQSLQGLTWVAFGGAYFLFSAEDIPGLALPWWLKFLSVLSSGGLCLAAFRYIPKYYERRFGSVERRVGPPDATFPILMLVLLVMMFVGPFVGRYLDSRIPALSDVVHRVISDPDHRANLLPVLYWFALLCAAGTNRSRFARLRWVSFSACLLLLWTGVLVFLPIRRPEIMQQPLWRFLNAGWFGISMMLLGLYDHLTLVRLLPVRSNQRR